MASTTSFTEESQPGFLRRMMQRIGDGMVVFIERQSRLDRVQRLRAKSDAELAEIGLRRDEIVRHVFRDRLFL